MMPAAMVTILILAALGMTPVLTWAATARGKLPLIVCGLLGAVSVVAYWCVIYGEIPLPQVVR